MDPQKGINLYKKNETTFLKTHSALCTLENNSFTNRNNTKAVIYVVRDPRNVITSLSVFSSLLTGFLITKCNEFGTWI